VREAILAGRLEEVMQWQGRAFAIEGIVVRGQKLGRTLGYPTINLARSFDQVLPPDGIYAGRVGEYLAAISIGFRPTVDGDHRTIEAYLLNYEGPNLYGTSVRLEVHHRLRDEVRFDTLDALTDQMALDVRDVLARLGG
jgi:riboflavin kinase/FMN adenylyltransferase